MHVIQHIQNSNASIILAQKSEHLLTLTWEELQNKYVVPFTLVEQLQKAIRSTASEHKMDLLIHTYDGISISRESQKLLENADVYNHLNSVAIILPSTTLRISLNLFSQLHNLSIPVRAFSNDSQAKNWLRKKRHSLKKK